MTAEFGHHAELWIPGRLPGLNDLVAAAKVRRRGFSAYAVMKEKAGRLAYYAALGAPRFRRVRIDFTWFEPDRRRDPDNVTGAGRKILLDSLVKGGMLPNDGWGAIESWTDRWEVNRAKPGVLLSITEVG